MDTIKPRAFGDLLKRYRTAAGLSQETLAERAGLSTRAISALEQGTRRAPRRETVRMLASALSLSDHEQAALEETISRKRTITSPPFFGAMHTLPVQPTPLIGRERETAEAASLLLHDALRLLTLTGPGGVGKTRLAVEVAAGVGDVFADGVFFVPLGSIGDPDLVVPSIARALGLRDAGDQTPTESLIGYVGDRRVLLVIDNFEHVLEAAPRIADVLAACPRVVALVTSRVPLRLRAEQEFAVVPLAVPPLMSQQDSNAVARYAAVRLFVQRAKAVYSGFTLTDADAPAIARICARLDGLPLAIELAAARIKLLTPAAILARLDHRLTFLTDGPCDLPVRLRTMRDAIAWSYNLLSVDQQALLRQLSVFVDGCTPEAAAYVCASGAGDGSSQDTTSDRLGALVEASLLLVVQGDHDGTPRVGMLETIREYALEQLRETGDLAVTQQRHADWYASYVERTITEPGGGPGQAQAFDRLAAEHGNVQAALTWTVDTGEIERGLRLAGRYAEVWYTRGYAGLGLRWLDALLARAPREGDDEYMIVLGRAFGETGVLATEQNDLTRAAALFEQRLVIERRLHRPLAIAWSLEALGIVALRRGDHVHSASFLEDAITSYRHLDAVEYLDSALVNLGEAFRAGGDHERALVIFTEALALGRQNSSDTDIAMALASLGHVAIRRGDLASAREYFTESMLLAHNLGDRVRTAEAIEGLAATMGMRGQPRRAIRLLGAMAMLRETAGVPSAPTGLSSADDRALYEETLTAAVDMLGEDGVAAVWAAGRGMPLEQAVTEALEEASAIN